MPSRPLPCALSAAAFLAAAAMLRGEVRTFQNGTTMPDGLLYWGAQDVQLLQASPTSDQANTTTLQVDTQASNGNPATQVQVLLKYNNLFGPLASQIPAGSTINAVSLTFNTVNVSAQSASLYRNSVLWHEQNTWSTLGPLSTGAADATVNPALTGSTVLSTVAMRDTVQAWADGQRNEGWSLINSGSDGWSFSSSETSTLANRPKLTIDYTPPAAPARPATPKNVVLFVADGMGLEHVKAAKLKTFGNTTSNFAFEFSNRGLMTHNNASDALTDSAASASALATGVKVANGVISQNPSGTPNQTALEILKSRGKRTGLVTTGTGITDATPAAFGAHESSRNNGTSIAGDFVTGSQPNVLFGQPGSMPSSPAGYHKITSEAQLLALDTNQPFVSGQFAGVTSTSGPSLALMATKALEVLNKDPDGFFLLVENEETDSYSHNNDEDPNAIAGVIAGVQSLSDAVDATVTWLANNGQLNNTLILVLSDHETGALEVLGGNGVGVNPTVDWDTTGHTQTPVGIWAMGPNAELVNDRTIDSTDVFRLITTSPEPSFLSLAVLGGVALVHRRKRH